MGPRQALGRATLSCLLALAALLTAGCNGSSRAEDPAAPPPGSPAATQPPATGRTAAPAVDPDHTVDRPGKRNGAVAFPDVIVTSARTIEGRTVAAVRKLKGVQDVERISLAQVLIENRAVQVAAVDPATYRNYTVAASADTQVVWNRLAGGEVALRPGLRTRLPIDRQGFLELGSAESASRVHIGAYAPLSPQIDAVVNDTWIPTLGMTRGNALLIRTGSTSPSTLRKPIQRVIAGADASVQMTDAVARFGLDPEVVQTAVVVGTIRDAVGTFRYSVLSGGRISPSPAWVSAHIVTRNVPILGAVTCNRLVIPQLAAALRDVQAQGLADKIDPTKYAGCYNPRFIAGTTTLSNHAFGLALDLNALDNQRGSAGEIDRGVVAIFKRWGFTWGGDWRYTDPMHFEMNQLVEPR